MFYVGLDLGQRRDHSAIAVVQGEESGRLAVRHVERIPLGTPYTEVVSGALGIVRDRRLRGRCVLVVDGSGVGAPVVDGLRAARPGCEICAVTITGGKRERRSGAFWNVSKRNL